MALIEKSMGRNRDLPQLEGLRFASATAGSAADFESIIVALPDLTSGAPAGTNMMGTTNNSMLLRTVSVVYEAALTGAATNNFTWNLNQYRNGALLVNTTSATTITAGTKTVTPASMVNVYVGTQLVFSGGTGATETVTVLAVTATTFDATFVNGHSSSYAITSAPLATITYASGTNDTKWVVRNLSVQKVNFIKGGDIVTLARVSSNATGLASPAGVIVLDWVPSQPR
jgi:hypothetical protein